MSFAKNNLRFLHIFIFSLLLAVVLQPVFSQTLYRDGIPVEEAVVKTPFPIKSLKWNITNSKFAYSEKNNIFIRDANNFDIIHIISYPNPLELMFSYENLLENDVISTISDSASLASWNIFENPDMITMPTSVEMKMEEEEKAGITSGAFSSDNGLIGFALTNGNVHLYYRLRYTLSSLHRTLEGHSEPVYAMSFSDDSRYLVTAAEDNRIIAWDTANWKLIADIPFYGSSKVQAVFTRTNDGIIAVTKKNEVTLFDFEGNAKHVFSLKDEIKDIQALHDGKRLAILTNKNRIELYSLESEKKKSDYLGHIPPCNPTEVTSFAFDAKDDYILEGYSDGSVYKFRTPKVMIKPGQRSPKIMDASSKEVVTENPYSSALKQKVIQEDLREQALENRKKNKKNQENEQVQQEQFQNQGLNFEYEWQRLRLEAGYGTLPTNNFIGTVDFAPRYEFTKLFPYYFGGGIDFNIAFPQGDFETSYYINGTKIGNPKIVGFRPFASAGINIPTKNNHLEFYSEVLLGPAVRSMWNGYIGKAMVATKFYTSFCAGISTGVSFYNALLRLEAFYDTSYDVMIQINAGYSLRLGKKILVTK